SRRPLLIGLGLILRVQERRKVVRVFTFRYGRFLAQICAEVDPFGGYAAGDLHLVVGDRFRDETVTADRHEPRLTFMPRIVPRGGALGCGGVAGLEALVGRRALIGRRVALCRTVTVSRAVIISGIDVGSRRSAVRIVLTLGSRPRSSNRGGRSGRSGSGSGGSGVSSARVIGLGGPTGVCQCSLGGGAVTADQGLRKPAADGFEDPFGEFIGSDRGVEDDIAVGFLVCA